MSPLESPFTLYFQDFEEIDKWVKDCGIDSLREQLAMSRIGYGSSQLVHDYLRLRDASEQTKLDEAQTALQSRATKAAEEAAAAALISAKAAAEANRRSTIANVIAVAALLVATLTYLFK